jgi:hypothetical protein
VTTSLLIASQALGNILQGAVGDQAVDLVGEGLADPYAGNQAERLEKSAAGTPYAGVKKLTERT